MPAIILITLITIAATLYELEIWRANKRLAFAVEVMRRAKRERLANYVEREASK